MGFRCGIVGLPNAGKSTLFNALTSSEAAETASYPFTTIEPHLGRVAVPDPRLAEIARLADSTRIMPTTLDFIDIAGLVEGASKGEGRGNQFLAHIREVDALIHVLRCFEDDRVSHVAGRLDPVADAEIVDTELMLADLESLERRLEGRSKKARGGDQDTKREADLAERVMAAVAAGEPARTITLVPGEKTPFYDLQLLTAKPVLYVCNVEEANTTGNAHSAAVTTWAEPQGAMTVPISAALEAEVARLDDAAERAAFLAEMGLAETGLARIVRAGYALLDLITFFTANANECHAWTLERGATAVDAAAKVHTDFAKGFIRAETAAYDDYLACGGEPGAREAGKLRAEGRDYVVADGDVIVFRFSS